jgi:hypothetical protein
MRLFVIICLSVWALAGCNANQAPPVGSARWNYSGVDDPIHYAQTSGFYAGR